MAEVCRGLHTAHELRDFSGAPLQVVHRDISPPNLMLTFDGRVKILDFGIARSQLRDSPVTAIGAVRGKPGYMAPEQLTGGDVDRRTDVFLVGIVLHEMLTGDRLFRADSFTALAYALMHQPIAAPSSRGARIPASLDALVLRCLARQPHERFTSAHEVAEALDAVSASADGETLEAFAARVLVERRLAHERFLRDLFRGAALAAGRAAGVDTMPASSATPTRKVVDKKRGRLAVMFAIAAVLAGGAAAAAWRVHAASDVVTVAANPAPAPRETVIVEAPPVQPVTTKVEVGHVSAQAHGKRVVRPPRGTRPVESTPAVVPPIGTAFLTVGAEPYALVRVNGQEIGPTPVFDHPVAAGSVTVELVTPDKHAVRLRRELSLRDGEHRRITTP
jgi:serine/threonine-protein kinase